MAPKAPPKKAPAKKGKGGADVESGLGGIVQDAQVPIWVDGESESENYGDLTLTRVEPSMLFEDTSEPVPIASTLGPWLKAWARPNVIFSPFKPLVVRPNTDCDPYQDVEVSDEGVTNQLTEDVKQAKVLAYREVKALRSSAPTEGPNKGAPSVHRRRKYENVEPSPNFMLAFNSAIMTVATMQQHVEKGNYLWELIYPQQSMSGYQYPVYNPTGKYVVKLFWQGSWRKVVIDDRLPTDLPGDCLLTVTEAKEIWPALLAKAMLKVLTPDNEQHLFKDPVWCLMTLMGGWLPQLLSPTADTSLTLKILRQELKGDSKQAPASQNDSFVAAKAPAARPGVSPAPGKKGGKDLAKSEDLGQSNPEEEPEGLLVMAVPGNAMTGTYLKTQSSTLLRLVSPHVQWKGPFSYTNNSEVWTTELENRLDCKRTDCFENDNKWHDFWLPWEQFIKYFGEVHVFRNTNTRKYAFAQQVTLAGIQDEMEPTPEGGTPAPVEPYTRYMYIKSPIATQVLFVLTGMRIPPEALLTDGESPAPSPSPQPSDSETPTVTPRGQGGKQESEVAIYSYQWKSASPVSYLATFSSKWGITNSMLLPVPKGEMVYQLEVSNLAPESLFAILSPRELVWSDEMDICQNHLGLSIWIDGGPFLPHERDEWNIWFKRHMCVKANTVATVDFAVLPPGVDLAAIQTQPATDAKKKGGKGAPAKGGGGDEGKKGKIKIFGPQLPAVPASEEDAEREKDELELLSHLTMVLINCDNGQILEGVINRIPITTLQPNKSGYMLMAYGSTPKAYPGGTYKLQVVSDTAVEKIDAKPFDTFVMKEGEYIKNPLGHICKYSLTSAELVFVSAQIDVADGGLRAPYNVHVQHNGETVFEKQDIIGSCYIPNLWLLPADKSNTSRYTLTVMLDPAVAALISQAHHQTAVDKFHKDKAVKAREAEEMANVHFASEVDMRSEKSIESRPQTNESARPTSVQSARNPKLPTPAGKVIDAKPSTKGLKKDMSIMEKAVPRTWNPTPKDNQILYCIRLHASSAKFSIDPDTSLQDEIQSLKSRWSKPEDKPEVPVKGKPKKDNKEDQASQLALDRAAKAKESRDRFLQTMSGSITLKDAAEGDPEAVVHPKPKMVQKGAKPPVVLSDDLKQSYLSERENKLKDHADEVAQHLKQRETEREELSQLMEYKDQKMSMLKSLRTQLHQEDRERQQKFWQQRREEEAASKAKAASEDDVLAKLMDDAAAKKAAAAGPAKGKKK